MMKSMGCRPSIRVDMVQRGCLACMVGFACVQRSYACFPCVLDGTSITDNGSGVNLTASACW